MLQVNLAYHSEHVRGIAEDYYSLLQEEDCRRTENGEASSDHVLVRTGLPVSGDDNALGPEYWRQNMVSLVRFAQSAGNMLSCKDGSELIIEIGPSGALAGPVAQIIKATPDARNAQYTSAARRGADTLLALYEVAGKLWANAGVVDLSRVNGYRQSKLVTCPTISGTTHDGTGASPFRQPSSCRDPSSATICWDRRSSRSRGITRPLPGDCAERRPVATRPQDWRPDHLPAAGYLAMAVEAMHQTAFMTRGRAVPPAAFAYCLKDVEFRRSLVLEEDARTKISLALSPVHASPRQSYSFRSISHGRSWVDHCTGIVRIDEES